MAERFFLEDLRPGRRRLPPELAHHLGRVLRLRRGAHLRFFDGTGLEADARIVATRRHGLEVDLEPPRPGGATPRRRVVLAFSPPRGARLEQILEHGTELGVAAFQPLLFERTPPAARRTEIPDRWHRVLRAAAGQCGAAAIPDLHDPAPLAHWLAAGPAAAGEFWFGEPGGLRPARVPADAPALAVVGPEGGFTAQERQALCAAGARPLDLGPFVLRVETAALAAAALLQPGPA